MSNDSLAVLHTRKGVTADVKQMVAKSRQELAQVANATITLLYWRIGMSIHSEILKKKEQIELLELGKSGIHVAEYLTELPSRNLLEKKLHAAIKTSRELMNAKVPELTEKQQKAKPKKTTQKKSPARKTTA